MHDRLRVHHDVDVGVRDVEEQVRLDQLQALVDQRRRVDRDDRAHVPGRVGQRLLDGDVGELVGGAAAERAAAGGEDQPGDLVAGAAAQALGQRRVLGVDRHELARARRRPVTSAPPAISDSLLASATVRPASSAASVGPQADRAGDAVEDDVGRAGGELLGGPGAGQDLRQGVLALRPAALRRRGVEGQLQVLRGGGPGDGDGADAERQRLLGEQGDVPAAGGQPGDPQPVGVLRGDGDRLPADRAGEPSSVTSRGELRRCILPDGAPLLARSSLRCSARVRQNVGARDAGSRGRTRRDGGRRAPARSNA